MRIPFALAGLMAAVTTLAATGQAMAQDFKPRIVRFGYGLVDESNQGRAARFFAKEVEKATGGKFVDWVKDSTEIAHPIPPGYKRGATTEATEGAK